MISILSFLLLAAPARSAPVPIPPEGRAYTGAYVDFGDTEDTVTAPAITKFVQLVGKHQAIIGSSSFWGRGGFPAANAQTICAGGAIPLIYWSPWGPPYEQGRHVDPGPWSLRRIVSGACDTYIDRWAAGAKAYARPLFVSFACEPNSNWYPWSGLETGADHPPGPGALAGDRFAGPDLYKRAWRHIVERVRAAGVTNVAWVFQANNTSHPDRPWNALAEYYPGADYIDWLGMSVYGQLTPGKDDWTPWTEAMDASYARLCALDPNEPVMLAEWGVGEFPASGNKAQFIRDAFDQLNHHKYPRLRAAVFWHERWQNADESWSNLRVNSSPGALAAYRQGVADAMWLATVPMP